MTEVRSQSAVPTPDTAAAKKVALAAAMGQFLEWYDYGIYGFLAVPIAANFFATGDQTTALLATFAVFAVPFIARPFGGVFCGFLADRIGRQKVLVFVLLMISAATVGIGLLPSYAAVGVIAPILLLLLRLVQGISAGGEVVSAMSFVAEYAPTHRRALYMSWGQSGSFLALLVGNIAGLTLATFLDQAQINSWGWRVPFMLALPLAIIGIQMRRKLDESPAFKAAQEASENEEPQPLKEALGNRSVRRAIVMCAALALLNSSGYYALLTYMPTYLTVNLKQPQWVSFSATALAVVVLLILIPVAATLSDRYGRRPLLIWSSVAMAVIAVPSYLLVAQGGALMLVGLFLLAASFAMYTGTIHPALAELFPTKVRVTAYAIGYNFSTAIFGGAAPLLLVALIASLGTTLIPAYYMIITAVGTAIAAFVMRESRGVDIETGTIEHG